MVFDVHNLSYQSFSNINLQLDSGSFYAIIGCNGSGKTTLFKLFSSIILTDNMISCNGVLLNTQSRIEYLKKIGIVKSLHQESFLCQTVKDEMEKPLVNLGYSRKMIEERVLDVLIYFDKIDLLDERIDKLSISDKVLLLIMTSLLHEPKILFLDGVLNILNRREKKEIIGLLNQLCLRKDLCIINFTANIDETMFCDKIFLLNNYQLMDVKTFDDLVWNDKTLLDNNLEVPFLYDLANKLKMYDLVKKEIDNMEELVDEIWH